ncbi:MAG: hypothetical protein HRU20_26340 [Pseudomonadales bacterium]|nr:hypothetical protein [Pseudomonadales bacterium]
MSSAALVNEKHYQVKLLLELLAAQDKTCATYAAQLKSIEAACVLLLEAGFSLFLNEVAASCQLKDNFSSVVHLQHALHDEQRSHAVVETLLELQADTQSWLYLLQSAAQKVHQGLAVNKPVVKSAQTLQFQDAGEGLELAHCLQEFTAFVEAQRSFLSEW